jgi:hypothetical protein
MPKRGGELKLSLQPMIERPSFWLAFVLPNELGTHCDFILRCFRMSVGHMFLNGTGTTAMYCDILIRREIFLGRTPAMSRHLLWVRPSYLAISSQTFR